MKKSTDKHDASRSLMLEPLESRCMLAGEVFLQSTDHNAAGKSFVRSQFVPHEMAIARNVTDRVVDDSQGTRASRPNGIDHRRDFGRLPGHPPRPDLHRELGVRGDRNGIDRNPSELSGASAPLSPNVQQVPRDRIEIPSRTQSVTVVTFVQPVDNDRPSTVSLIASRPTSTNRAAASSTVQTRSLLTLNENQRAAVVVAAAEESTDSNTSDGLQVDRHDPQSSNDVSIDRYVENLSSPSSVTSGTIDPIVSAGHDFHGEPKSENDDQWEVDIEMLDQLRQIANRSGAARSGSVSHITDALIAKSIQAGDGWIDVVFNGDIPVERDDFEPALVDVVLSATMGLHRSIDIASISETNDLSAEIRDVILAAIAAEQPGRFESLSKPSDTPFSSFAYSSAIVFAGSMALVRRRRQLVKLESTNSANHSSSSPKSSVNGMAGSSGARFRSLRCKLRR